MRAVGRHQATVVAVGIWAGLLVVAIVWGQYLLPGGDLNAPGPPFQGHYRFSLLSVVPAALFAVAAALLLPSLASRLRWGPLLGLAWLLAASWAVLLAAWDGHRSLGSPISGRNEYLRAIPMVGDRPVDFLQTFADGVAQRDFPVHVNGHPPLMVFVYWAWDRVGLVGELWAAALVIGAGSSAVVAVALTLRALGGEGAARNVLPFLVLAPFAITVATSADAFFLAVGAWAAAALTYGVRRGSPVLLASGALLTGALPYLSYGLLPLGAILVVAVVLALRRREERLGPTAVAAVLVGLAVVPVLMTLGGFWWPDGVVATHRAWALGRGDDRPYAYSFVGDFAVLGVLVGPAAFAAVARRPRRVVVALAAASLVGVLSLALSGVTRLEVERIWLPYAPWIVVVCAALPRSSRCGWLLANALCAVAFQVFVLDAW